MVRPKAFDTEQALDKALHLFTLKGYVGSSMQDLVVAMGINRQSIYDTFGNKSELFNQALEKYGAMNRLHFSTPLSSPQADMDTIRDRFAMLISEATQDTEHKGCMLINCIVEMHLLDDQASSRVSYFHSLWATGFLIALNNAAAKGQIREEFTNENMSHLLATLTAGLLIDAKAGISARTLSAVVDATLSIFT